MMETETERLRRQLAGAVAALERIAHHEREGDYAGQVNAMRAIASDALPAAGGQYEAAPPNKRKDADGDR